MKYKWPGFTCMQTSGLTKSFRKISGHKFIRGEKEIKLHLTLPTPTVFRNLLKHDIHDMDSSYDAVSPGGGSFRRPGTADRRNCIRLSDQSFKSSLQGAGLDITIMVKKRAGEETLTK